jgi:class 3 adenylate cyclase
LACAFELHAEIERWNTKRAAREAQRLSIAIGVHFGPVVVGNLGSENRLEFTVVGDVVNVASRLEEATRPSSQPLPDRTGVSTISGQTALMRIPLDGYSRADPPG